MNWTMQCIGENRIGSLACLRLAACYQTSIILYQSTRRCCLFLFSRIRFIHDQELKRWPRNPRQELELGWNVPKTEKLVE